MEWGREIESSLRRNIKGRCKWKYTDNMDQSVLADSKTEFTIRKFLPSYADVANQISLPESLSLANSELEVNAIARGYSFADWGSQQDSRWEVPSTHPGQNRNNCISMSFLASKGKPVSFYNEFRGIDRAFYIAYIKDGFVHPSGAVGVACGYYMGEECCENRWDYAREWYTNCQAELSRQKLPWTSLWSDSIPSAGRDQLIEQCTDHRDLGLPFNGRVSSHVPTTVSKVFVMPALWDYNFHHFVADSLARLSHSIKYLRRHPDVYIHTREFETYDHMRYRDTGFAESARGMRCRVFELLGLNCSRLITGMVLAEDVMIPRCTRCAYSLSNPMEIRLLRRILHASSVRALSGTHNVTVTATATGRPAPTPNQGKFAFVDAANLLHSQFSKLRRKKSPIPSATDAPRHPPRDASSPAPQNLTMVVLQRWTASSTDRDWDDDTFHNITTALQSAFPDHHIVRLSSKDIQSPRYCIACDILTYSRADILVGAHGAGLTNVMFLPPEAMLIEIVGEFKDVNMPVCGYYGPMASMFGVHHYLYVHGMAKHEGPTALNATAMAVGAAAFYRSVRDVAARTPSTDSSILRVSNSTGRPVHCRP